jgi:hypothetical protein
LRSEYSRLALCLVLGSGVGAVIGVVLDDTALGIGLGGAIGIGLWVAWSAVDGRRK